MSEMAQQGETFQNPTPEASVPPVGEDTIRFATLKRRRDDGDASAAEGTIVDVPPSKRLQVAQDIVFRIGVPSRQIGKVIGKVGTRIQKIREETKATIKVADAIAVSRIIRSFVYVVWFSEKILEGKQNII